MRATFGGPEKYLFERIEGYSIRAALQPDRGIDNAFYVSVLLRSDSNQALPKLPTWDKRVSQDDPVSDELVIADGKEGSETLKYVFPGITFLGCESACTNRYQYHNLQFRYDESFRPTPPEIAIKNTKKPQHTLQTSKSKGALVIGKQLPAPLLAFEASQTTAGATVLRLVSERCKRKGWLPELLEQDRKTGDDGDGAKLTFKVNGVEWDCARDDDESKHGLLYMTYEEYYGLCLRFRTASLQKAGQGSPAFLEEEPDLADLFGESPHSIVEGWQGGRKQPQVAQGPADGDVTPEEAVEICTVVSNTPAGRLFDWRTKFMRKGA